MKRVMLILAVACGLVLRVNADTNVAVYVSIVNGKAVIRAQASNDVASFSIVGSAVTATNPVYSVPPSTPPIEGWITNVVPGTSLNGASIWLGVCFTNATSQSITALGRWVVSGNSQTHAVALLRLDLYTVQAQVNVNTSGQTAGAFAWGNTNVTLVPGIVYALLSQETSGGDYYLDDDTAVTADSSLVTLGLPCYWQGTGFEIVTHGSLGHAYGPVSFK